MDKRIAIGLVWFESQLVVGRRTEEQTLGGYDEFPGGKCESGESPEDAVVRECLEETGLNVRVIGLRENVRHKYKHGILDFWFFDCQPIEKPASLLLEPFAWVQIKDVVRMRFPPANIPILRSIEEHPGPIS